MTDNKNKEQTFKVSKDGFSELHDLAEMVIATKTNASKSGKEVLSGEVLAAKALQEQIDAAIENELECLYFTESEVLFLAEVVTGDE